MGLIQRVISGEQADPTEINLVDSDLQLEKINALNDSLNYSSIKSNK